MDYGKQNAVAHILAQQTIIQSKHVSSDIKDASETTASSDGYAEQKVSNGVSDLGQLTGDSVAEIARLSFTAYKAYKNKRAQKTAESFSAPSTHINPINAGSENSLDFELRRSELKKRHMKTELIRNHITEIARNKLPLKTPTYRKKPRVISKTTAHKARKTTTRFAAKIGRRILAAIRRLVLHAAKAAATALIALLSSSSVLLILCIGIAAVAALLSSPMGIIFSDKNTDPKAVSIPSIIAETNKEFGEKIDKTVADNPNCSEVNIVYNYPSGKTWSSYWSEIVAVFAVHHNLVGDDDVILIDSKKAKKLKDAFWEMHDISSNVAYRKVWVEVADPPAEGDDNLTGGNTTHWEEQEIYTLNVTVSSISVEELADKYHFTKDQRDIMHELLSAEMGPFLDSLCGTGAIAGDGSLSWPLPGYTNISTHFGVPDAFGNPGHKGIDIPAGEGTPILAAHSGTVMIASWNDSYGNQILLDSGGGISTRYAHLSGFAVSPGQSVSAGDVIGYVGSTGNSTGSHLHFELYVSGALVNPLDHVSPS